MNHKARPVRAEHHPWVFSYGSNLHIDQMQRRCPDSRPVSRLTLHGFKLVFRGVADIVPTGDPADVVEGAVYSISARDEQALDRYEGFRRDAPQDGLYRKEFFPVLLNAESTEPVQVMYYVMNRGTIAPPGARYYETIEEGFEAWGIPLGTLEAACLDADEQADVLSWLARLPTTASR